LIALTQGQEVALWKLLKAIFSLRKEKRGGKFLKESKRTCDPGRGNENGVRGQGKVGGEALRQHYRRKKGFAGEKK